MSFDFASKIKKGPSKRAPKIMLIGVEGIGKTTAGAQCESPIFLCAEDGLVGQGYDGAAHFTPGKWEEVLEFLRYLGEQPHEYKSLVIDTIDWLEPLMFTYICNRDSKYQGKDVVAAVASVENYGYGKGYTIAADEFRKALALLEAVNRRGMLVMINAHCHVKLFNNPDGENYDRYEPKVSKQIAGLVKEWCDVVLFARYEVFTHKASKGAKAKGVGGQDRIVHTQHSAAWDAKNRFGLPAKMPLDVPAILAAINEGSGPDSAENIIEDIAALLPELPEDEREKAAAFIEANKTNVHKLVKLLNRIRTLTNRQEVANGQV